MDKRITFSLDLTTDQARRAVDEFVSQLNKSAQGASSSVSEWNKVGSAISDSFKRALQDVRQLQEQIREEMKKGAAGIMQPGSPASISGKLSDGLKDLIRSEHEAVKAAIRTTEQELQKNRDEYAAMVKQLDQKKLDPEIARQMAGQQDKIRSLEQELVGREQASQVLQNALRSKSPQAGDIIGAMGGNPPAPAGPPDPFKFAGKAGAFAQLIAGGGDLTTLMSGGGAMSVLTALGGGGGAAMGTVLLTADRLIKGMQNRAAAEVLMGRQFATGGAMSVTADLLTREAIKGMPTGAYATAMSAGTDITGFQSGLGFVDSLDQLRVFVQSGFSRSAANNYTREKLLQEQMGAFGPYQEQAFTNAIARGQMFNPVERMFGMDSTQRTMSMLQGMGIPLERARPAVTMMAELMGRLPGFPGDRQLINAQNRFNLSDDALRQVIRAQAGDPSAMATITGMMGMSGLGTATTDIATGRVMQAGAEYAGRFDAAAVPGAMSVFTRGFEAVSGAFVGPGMPSTAEQARYSNQVTTQRLSELNNPESLSNITAMGTLARLGITDPVEARIIMSMGLDNPRTVDAISRMTGKTPEQIRGAMSASQGQLETQQRRRFGGGRLDEVMGRDFTFNALRAGTGRDTDMVRAQGAFNLSTLLGGGPPSEAQLEAGRGRATGRADTTADTVAETNARIAANLDVLTKVFDGEGLKVKIISAGGKVTDEAQRSAVERAVDNARANVPSVGTQDRRMKSGRGN